MNREEREARIRELWGVIGQAERELTYLDPSKRLLKSLSTAVEEVQADLAAGDDYESRTEELCMRVVEALNALNEKAEGLVTLRPDSVTIGTDGGTITYDTDGQEWYHSPARA